MTFPNRCKEKFHLHFRIARFVLESNAEFCTASQKRRWVHTISSRITCNSRFELQTIIALKSLDLEHEGSESFRSWKIKLRTMV